MHILAQDGFVHMMNLQLSDLWTLILAFIVCNNKSTPTFLPSCTHTHTHTQFWINDLNVGSNLKSNSNHIKSSCDFIAFNHDSSSKCTLTHQHYISWYYTIHANHDLVMHTHHPLLVALKHGVKNCCYSIRYHNFRAVWILTMAWLMLLRSPGQSEMEFACLATVHSAVFDDQEINTVSLLQYMFKPTYVYANDESTSLCSSNTPLVARDVFLMACWSICPLRFESPLDHQNWPAWQACSSTFNPAFSLAIFQVPLVQGRELPCRTHLWHHLSLPFPSPLHSPLLPIHAPLPRSSLILSSLSLLRCG